MYDIVRVAFKTNARTMPVHPFVKRIVQKEISKQWTNYPTLRCPLLANALATVLLLNGCPQPSPDVQQHPLAARFAPGPCNSTRSHRVITTVGGEARSANPPSDEQFRVRTIGWWGMTETMTHGIIGDVHHANRSMMIGKTAPEYGVAILRDDASPADPGEVGHLRIQGIPGVSLFKEYLNNEQATAAAYDEEGWFITGDRVILHQDGFIQFADRDKDMLKVGGENVAASEIERVIVEMPEAAEVAVVAKKDPMRDEVPVAFVLPEGDPASPPPDLSERILAVCRDQLADFKVSREVFLVDDFPRSTLEKISKVELRRRFDDDGN